MILKELPTALGETRHELGVGSPTPPKNTAAGHSLSTCAIMLAS